MHPGRSEYKVILIENSDDLLEQIKINKNTLMFDYLNNILENLICQKELSAIDEILNKIYMLINKELNNRVGELTVDYSMKELFYLISKSEIYTTNCKDIEVLSNYELLNIFCKLLKENNAITSKKMIIIIPNIDYLCNREEYIKIANFLTKFNDNIYYIFGISSENYVFLDKTIMSYVAVINDKLFQTPSFDKIYDYILNNYPINKELNEKELLNILMKMLNRVGINNDYNCYKDLIVKKYINKALCINDIYNFNMTESELSCINS